MTPAEAIHYLADESRRDRELERILFAASDTHADIYAWAEADPERVVALAESWQGVVAQDIPPPDWVAQP